jgi:tRNA (Thr-GGU) A37 N-methylase
MDTVVYHPIGVVRSPFDTPEDVPLDPSRSVDAVGRIELKAEQQDGLTLLDDSHTSWSWLTSTWSGGLIW